MEGRRGCLVALGLLVLVSGCLGSVGPERSMETVELTVSTPTAQTEPPAQPRTIRFPGPGYGATALITDGSGAGVVVDAGGDRNATGARRALAATGVDRYDLWITGFNETRFRGATRLVQQRPPDNIGFNGLTRNASSYHGFLRAVVDADRQYYFYSETAGFSYAPAGGSIEVIGPPPEYLANGTPAHNEIVLAYTAVGSRVLWMGDPGRQEEAWLVEQSDADLTADVLVLAAGASPSDGLLDAIDPEIAVLQGEAGANRTAALLENRSTVYRPGVEETVRLRLVENETRVSVVAPGTRDSAGTATRIPSGGTATDTQQVVTPTGTPPAESTSPTPSAATTDTPDGTPS